MSGSDALIALESGGDFINILENKQVPELLLVSKEEEVLQKQAAKKVIRRNLQNSQADNL